MEIQLEKFNSIKSLRDLPHGFEPRKVISPENLKTYVDGYFPVLTKKEHKAIEDKSEDFFNKSSQDLFYEIIHEIDLNCINIPGNIADQVKRYLMYIRKHFTSQIWYLKHRFDYETVLKPTEDKEHTNWDVKYLDENEEWEMGVTIEMRYNGEDPIGLYLSGCRNFIEMYQRVINHIDSLLNNEYNNNQHSKELTSHGTGDDLFVSQLEVADPLNIFNSDHRAHWRLFFDILKRCSPPVISNDNEWIDTQSDGWHYFKELQLNGIFVGNVRPATAARFFEHEFQLKKHNFDKGSRSTLSDSKKERFQHAIETVLSDLKLSESA